VKENAMENGIENFDEDDEISTVKLNMKESNKELHTSNIYDDITKHWLLLATRQLPFLY
jgi:hypothetical protein